MKKLKLKIIIPAILLLVILPLLLVGKANEMGYCVAEFRKLSDDELYERGMRNYMNYLVGPQNLGLKNNLPLSEKDPDTAIYPDTGGSKGFNYPLWILDGKITAEEYGAKIHEYGKTDVDEQDWHRFDKTIRFLKARTVLDGLSPTLQVAQRNNNFGFLYIDYSTLSFMAYDCCYVADSNELKKYTNFYKGNIYEYYQNEPTLRKPFWKKYTGWREVFLILDEHIADSVRNINGRQKYAMATNINNILFVPISNCGLIDRTYMLFNINHRLENNDDNHQ